MSNKKQPQRKPEFPNRLCRAVGHDWQTTTIGDYRVCQREGCYATQRHVNGRWENTLHRTSGWIDAHEADQQRATLPQQSTLW